MQRTGKTGTGLAYVDVDLVAPWSAGGLPVVFHHGIGTDHRVWSDWLPSIASRHRCLAFDTRGFGASDVPPAEHRFTLEEALDDLMDVVGRAESERVHLVGESFGGTVCLLAGIRHPERIASITVSNTAFKGSGIAHVGGWREAFRRAGAEAWSRDMMAKRFHDGAIDEARWRWFHEVQSRSPAHVTAGLGELLAGTDLGEQLGRIMAPLLILMPDGSPFVTPPMGVELQGRVAGAELAVFPGTRHGLPFSHGRECGALLARHIARAEQRAG